MGFLLWAGLGAVVGFIAAHRRGFSPVSGVVAGLMLGPLAGLLFVVPLGLPRFRGRVRTWVSSALLQLSPLVVDG